jgi:hypothetical protein
MRTAILASVNLGVLLLLTNGQALGQNVGRPLGGPYAGSTVSPYLNLNRFGAPAALNYYNLVRPEFAFQNSINNLFAGQNALSRQQTNLIEGDVPATTGHPFGYFTHTRYFLNNRGGGQGAGMARAGQGAAGAAAGGAARGVPGR